MLLDIDHFVSSLAQRIAGFPAQALALAKASVTNTGSIEEELNFEERVFLEAVHSEPARRRMDAAMAMGMQTPIIEKCCFTHIWSPLAGV